MTTSHEDDLLQAANEDILQPLFTIEPQIAQPEEEEPEFKLENAEFDPRYKDPFLGLLYLGKLTDTVRKFGHTFTLETPSQAVRLETGLVHKKYANTLTSELAWAAITVAAYLTNVDGTILPQPIGPHDTGIVARVAWILDNLHNFVIQSLYEDCLILEARVSQTLQELERLGKY